MQKNLFKAAAIMIGMAMSMSSLTACGSDDDEPENNQEETTTSNYLGGVKYIINLSDTWYNFFDIKVTYIDIYGESHSGTLGENITETRFADFNKVSKSLSMTITAEPKGATPTFANDSTYKFTNNSAMYVYKCLATETDVYPIDGYAATKGNINVHGYTEGKSGMAEFLGESHDLFGHSYSF
jgi:hypothetical protein